MRALAALVLALACAACSSAGAAQPSPQSPLQRELAGLVARMERVHPDLYHSVTRERMRAEVDELVRRAPSLSRSELVVGLMRVVGLLGERDGHSGLYPLDLHHPRGAYTAAERLLKPARRPRVRRVVIDVRDERPVGRVVAAAVRSRLGAPPGESVRARHARGRLAHHDRAGRPARSHRG